MTIQLPSDLSNAITSSPLTSPQNSPPRGGQSSKNNEELVRQCALSQINPRNLPASSSLPIPACRLFPPQDPENTTPKDGEITTCSPRKGRKQKRRAPLIPLLNLRDIDPSLSAGPDQVPNGSSPTFCPTLSTALPQLLAFQSVGAWQDQEADNVDSVICYVAARFPDFSISWGSVDWQPRLTIIQELRKKVEQSKDLKDAQKADFLAQLDLANQRLTKDATSPDS